MPGNNHWSEERWNRLVEQWCIDFGPESAAKIIQSSIVAIGGERITFPSLKDLERRERDRRICDFHRGDFSETAAHFGISDCTARRAVLKQRMLERDKFSSLAGT